jgi:phosphotransferase system enzyme I (PtsI)
MFPHNVIFRTFDVGGDKLTPERFEEDNPFLGWRGIRVCLDRPEILLTQLRAILRASTRRNVSIMFPMVTKLSEVRRAKELLKQVKDELKAKGVRFDQRLKVGVMIEVPAAAILAESIAAEVDFLSIGTNDLIQYLLAVDRGNSLVAPIYQQFNPAVLRTIKMIVEAGHKHNIWVGMCGEMAGDPLATIVLMGLGLDELSVIPTTLPEIKKIIRSVKHKDAKKIADKVLTLTTEDEIHQYLFSTLKGKLPDLPLEP